MRTDGPRLTLAAVRAHLLAALRTGQPFPLWSFATVVAYSVVANAGFGPASTSPLPTSLAVLAVGTLPMGALFLVARRWARRVRTRRARHVLAVYVGLGLSRGIGIQAITTLMGLDWVPTGYRLAISAVLGTVLMATFAGIDTLVRDQRLSRAAAQQEIARLAREADRLAADRNEIRNLLDHRIDRLEQARRELVSGRADRGRAIAFLRQAATESTRIATKPQTVTTPRLPSLATYWATEDTLDPRLALAFSGIFSGMIVAFLTKGLAPWLLATGGVVAGQGILMLAGITLLRPLRRRLPAPASAVVSVVSYLAFGAGTAVLVRLTTGTTGGGLWLTLWVAAWVGVSDVLSASVGRAMDITSWVERMHAEHRAAERESRNAMLDSRIRLVELRRRHGSIAELEQLVTESPDEAGLRGVADRIDDLLARGRRPLPGRPLVDELAEALERARPAVPMTTRVHGDAAPLTDAAVFAVALVLSEIARGLPEGSGAAEVQVGVDAEEIHLVLTCALPVPIGRDTALVLSTLCLRWTSSEATGRVSATLPAYRRGDGVLPVQPGVDAAPASTVVADSAALPSPREHQAQEAGSPAAAGG